LQILKTSEEAWLGDFTTSFRTSKRVDLEYDKENK
jgi:hypothetical protein